MKSRKSLVRREVSSQVRTIVGGRYSDTVQPSWYAYVSTDKSFDGTEYEHLELRCHDGAKSHEFSFFLRPGTLADIHREIGRVLAEAKETVAVA